jgi:hypothetical protein
MSQRENAGFRDAPLLAVGAGDKAAVVPRSLLPPLRFASFSAPSGVLPFFDPSVARGVAQPVANVAASSRLSMCPCALRRSAASGFVCSPPRFSLIAFGVGHPLTSSTVLRLESLFPAALFPFCAGVPAIGVGQPAVCARSLRLPRTVPLGLTRRPSLSRVRPAACRRSPVGVGQPAVCATSFR